MARERDEVNALGGADIVRFAADGDEIRECKRRRLTCHVAELSTTGTATAPSTPTTSIRAGKCPDRRFSLLYRSIPCYFVRQSGNPNANPPLPRQLWWTRATNVIPYPLTRLPLSTEVKKKNTPFPKSHGSLLKVASKATAQEKAPELTLNSGRNTRPSLSGYRLLT